MQLIEQPAAAAAETDGFDIRGDQLQITRPTRFDARAIISGRAPLRGADSPVLRCGVRAGAHRRARR